MLDLVLLLSCAASATLHTVQYTVHGFANINHSMALVTASQGLTRECATEMQVLRKAVSTGAQLPTDLSVASQVLTLPGGGLLIYSPGNATEQRDELEKLGTPKVVVVPSLYHDGFAVMMQAAYPHAVFVAPHAITTKFPSLRVDHVLDAADDNPGNRPLALPAKLAELVGPNISFYQNVDQSRELVVHDKGARALLTCDILYAASTASAAPDPTRSPLMSIFYKAYKVNSVAPPLNSYRTWLATPPEDVMRLEAGSGGGQQQGDVLWLNRMHLSLNEDPKARKVDPAKMLAFQNAVMAEIEPLERIATGHYGIVDAPTARGVLQMQSAWLHRYA